MSNITSILFIIFGFFIILIFFSYIYFHFAYISNNLQKSSYSNSYNRSITQPEQPYLAYEKDPVYDYDKVSSLLYQPPSQPEQPYLAYEQDPVYDYDKVSSLLYQPPSQPTTTITTPPLSPPTTTTNSRANHLTYLRSQESNPETINVSYPTTKPYGYGSIKGWYGSKQSSYLLNHPIKNEYEQMNQNYVTNNEQWKFLHFPRKDELPNYGSWWNWDLELQKINNVIDYLGETLGKFETHFISATEIVDKLKWVPKTKFGQEQRFEITNVSLRDALASKISVTNRNATISFTQQEWDSFNITTNIRTLHYIKIGDSQYKPFSPGTDRVNNEALAIISRDWEIGASPENTTPNQEVQVEECGGVCLIYKTKNNRQRVYMAVDLGMGPYERLNDSDFINKSNDYKKQWLRNEIYSSISHEYSHVVQRQLIDPILPGRWHNGIWHGQDNKELGERSPNAISKWWIESFATILPYFLGFQNELDIRGQIVQSITEIKNNNPTTSQEFADRMMYVQPYGYLTKPYWSFLAAAYMAKLTSWKYILVDFYYDFQRVPSNTRAIASNPGATASNNNNDIYYVPDLDKLFLHNFGKTEENFLKDLYTLIKTDTTIDINYFLPNNGENLLTTANVLQAGSSRYNVEGFGNYNENNSNKLCKIM